MGNNDSLIQRPYFEKEYEQMDSNIVALDIRLHLSFQGSALDAFFNHHCWYTWHFGKMVMF